MANEIVNYPDVSWPEVVNATLGYKNGITEDHLSTSVQEKLNRESGGGDTKPAGGWGTNDIANGAITTDKLAGSAVTAAKIASGAVTEGKIGSGAVTSGKLGTGAVTETKIADGAITAAKVAAGVIPGWYYYASTSAYNTDAVNVPNGSYVLIGTTQIILYRKAAGSLSQICAWPTGGGGTIDLAPNGIGYAVSPSQLDTTARTATMTGYVLRVNGLVAVKFGSAVEGPNPTLNINSTYAVPMYYRGNPLAGGKILSGDTALFVFDGNYYHLLGIDRVESSGGSGPAVPTPTVADAGKILSVDSTGAYVLVLPTTWNPGGSY